MDIKEFENLFKEYEQKKDDLFNQLDQIELVIREEYTKAIKLLPNLIQDVLNQYYIAKVSYVDESSNFQLNLYELDNNYNSIKIKNKTFKFNRIIVIHIEIDEIKSDSGLSLSKSIIRSFRKITNEKITKYSEYVEGNRESIKDCLEDIDMYNEEICEFESDQLLARNILSEIEEFESKNK